MCAVLCSLKDATSFDLLRTDLVVLQLRSSGP